MSDVGYISLPIAAHPAYFNYHFACRFRIHAVVHFTNSFLCAECLADTLKLSKSGRFESNDLVELKSRLEAGIDVVYSVWDERQPTTADEKTITAFLATFFYSFDSMLDLGVVKLIESHAELLLWLLSHSYACKVAVSQQLEVPLLTKLVNAFRGHIASLASLTDDAVSQQLTLLLTLASEAQFAALLVQDGSEVRLLAAC